MYVPNTRKIIFLYDVVFDNKKSSTLADTSQPYAKTMAMHPAVLYILCATSSKEKIGNIITIAQFEEGGLLSETRSDAEIEDKSGDKSNYNSIIPPLLSLEELNTLDSGNESDDESMSTEML